RSVLPVEDVRAVSGVADDASDELRFPGRVVPVSLQLPFEGAATERNPNSFDVTTPAGDLLLTATLAPEDVAQARARWRRATLSLALIVLAITAALLAGPILDWRNRAR